MQVLSNQEISDSHSTGGQHKVVSMLFSSGDSGYARCCAKNEIQKLSRQMALANYVTWTPCGHPAQILILSWVRP